MNIYKIILKAFSRFNFYVVNTNFSQGFLRVSGEKIVNDVNDNYILKVWDLVAG